MREGNAFTSRQLKDALMQVPPHLQQQHMSQDEGCKAISAGQGLKEEEHFSVPNKFSGVGQNGSDCDLVTNGGGGDWKPSVIPAGQTIVDEDGSGKTEAESEKDDEADDQVELFLLFFEIGVPHIFDLPFVQAGRLEEKIYAEQMLLEWNREKEKFLGAAGSSSDSNSRFQMQSLLTLPTVRQLLLSASRDRVLNPLYEYVHDQDVFLTNLVQLYMNFVLEDAPTPQPQQ